MLADSGTGRLEVRCRGDRLVLIIYIGPEENTQMEIPLNLQQALEFLNTVVRNVEHLKKICEN